MDKCLSAGSGSVPSPNSPISLPVANRIWNYAGNMVLSDARALSGSDMAPSRSAAALRERQALEQLLYLIIPESSRNTAERLLDAHGSLSRVLTAFSDCETQDPVEKLLGAARQTLVQSLRSEVANKPIICTTEAVIEYLSFSMSGYTTEQVRALFLDTKNMLIRDETVSNGTVNEAVIYPREILRQALQCGSTAIIIAHNHPSGDPQPSKSDVDATKRLAAAGRELGIVIHDHIIISNTGWVSLRAQGFMR